MAASPRRSLSRWGRKSVTMTAATSSPDRSWISSCRPRSKRRIGRPTSPSPRRRIIRSAPRESAKARTSAAYRPSPMPSTTPSPSLARRTSRCRMIIGGTGRRRRHWARWLSVFTARNDVFLLVIPGRCESIEPGISRFRVRSCGPSRNDGNRSMKDREEIAQALAASGYIADAELATAISLMQRLRRPLLLEGEAGVGKTEVAKALASVHATELIRLQCYEGLDQSSSLYEWNYQRQLLAIQAHRGAASSIEDQIFSEKYLLERPLLAAIRRERPPVLLIDEIDRADDEFEAFLLELLSDFQVSIPELGTIRAVSIPHVVLTSNGTRELSDALRRRCLYHYVDYPDVEREARIIMARIDGASASLSLQIARMVEGIRKEELRKVPGVAETLDWASALVGLDVRDLHDAPETVHETLMCLLKTQEDKVRVTREVSERILGKVA